MRDRNEDSIRKTLLAMSGAVPPVGMEERIMRRFERIPMLLERPDPMRTVTLQRSSSSRDVSPPLPGRGVCGRMLAFRRLTGQPHN
jgi:hypothetical protein